MKIFTLPSWYKSSKKPEAAIFVYEQMLALKKLGDKPVVLVAEPVSIKEKRKADKKIIFENDHGILTYRTEIQSLYPSRFRKQHIFVFREALQKLLNKAIKEQGKPDVFYAHFSYPAGMIAVELSQKYHIPLVVEEHYSGIMEKRIDRVLLECIRKSVEKSDTFIAVSFGLKKSIEDKLGKETNIKIISNMIHNNFRYCPRTDHEGFVFFACGTLIPRKGFSELIAAFSKEFGTDKNIILRIGGSGEQERQLKDLINENEMEDRITLLGQLNRDDTIREYKDCDCFVLPSKAETYGLVYREALAIGRPIISTMHGGFAENDWHNEYGKLIPVDDEKALRSAMRQIVLSYSQYEQDKISQLVLRECSEETVSRKIHHELATVCERIRVR